MNIFILGNINHMPVVKMFVSLDLEPIYLFLDRHYLFFERGKGCVYSRNR